MTSKSKRDCCLRLADYCKGYICQQQKICCVCGLECHEIDKVNALYDSESPFPFDNLHHSHVDNYSTPECLYDNDYLNCVMLDKQALKKLLLIMIYFRCGECHLSLKSKCLPKFTLANKL